MKFSTIALALSAIVTPSAAEYVCHSDVFFTFDADSTPSAAAQKYLGSALVIAFNEAYASVDDISMDGDDTEDFEIGDSATVLLRGSTNLLGRRTGKQGSSGSWGCNNCKVDDDATELTSLSAIEFGDALLSSKEHMLWEKLFCAKGRANAEFSTMSDCKIVLSNCHNEADDYVSGIPSVVELLAIASAKMNIN